jgi:hypothetical protein
MKKFIQTNISKIEKFIKYILISLLIYLSLKCICINKLTNKEILIISFISSISYAILDMISPTIKIYNNSNIYRCIN